MTPCPSHDPWPSCQAGAAQCSGPPSSEPQGAAMAEDLPGPPGSDSRDDRPGEPPTEPTKPPGGPAQPPMPPPSSGQPGGAQQPLGYGPAAQEPQPYAQQYGYGQPGYGYPPGPQTEGMATAALIVAIAGSLSARRPARSWPWSWPTTPDSASRPPAGGCPAWSRPGRPDHRRHRAGPDRHRGAGRGDRHGDRAQRVTSGQEEGVPHPTPQSMNVGIVQQLDHEASSVGSLSTSA